MDYLLQKKLHILVQLALVDEIFTDSERASIMKIGLDHGATVDEIEEVFRHPNMKESLVPMNLVQKADLLLDSVLVVMADRRIEDDEAFFVRQLARKLGFREEVVTFLIEYQTMDRSVLHELMIPYLIQ